MIGFDDSVLDAEETLCGIACLDPRASLETGLRPIHFHHPDCRVLWATLLEVYESEVAVSVEQEVAVRLSEAGTPEVAALLESLRRDKFDPESTPQMASLVRQAYLDRKYAHQLEDQLRKLRSGNHADDLIGTAIDSLADLQSSCGARGLITAADMVADELQAIDDERAGIAQQNSSLELPWGLGKYIPGGCPGNKLSFIMGPTGGFKSTIANGWARHFAQTITDGVIVKIGLEDAAVMEAQKLLAVTAQVPLSKIVNRDLTPGDISRLRHVGGDWLSRLVLIDDVVPTSDEMIRAYRAIPGVRGVVYDYLQLIDWEGDIERVAIHRFCVKAQRAAKRDNVAHVALSQVREDLIDASEDKRPRMQQLFGSSASRNMAKLICGVYRPWAYYPDPGQLPKADSVEYGKWAAENPELYENLVELVIRKNQLGPIDYAVKLLVKPETGEIESW